MPDPHNLVHEIILPINAPGEYGDQICSFLTLGDKFLVWQVICGEEGSGFCHALKWYLPADLAFPLVIITWQCSFSGN
jgi:hypothetical protein